MPWIGRLLQIVFLVGACLLVAAPAQARVLRPNALDRSVTAISTAQLLTGPAPSLVDADRQEAAARYARWRISGFLAMVLLQIVALGYLWSSGWAARARDAMRANVHSEFAVRWCFGAMLAIVAKCAALVPMFYLFRVDVVMGLSNEGAYRWWFDWLVSVGFAAVAAGFVAAVVLWLADRTHQWYVYTILGFVVASLAIAFFSPVLVVPLYNTQKPLVDSRFAAVRRMERLAARAGVPIVIEDRSRRSQSATSAQVTGLWATQRIVLSDTLVAGSTPEEVAFSIARELGHVVDSDPLRMAWLDAFVAVFGVALAVFVADRIGFRRDDDPVSRLALVGALFGCVYLVALPPYNAVQRALESGAEGYAVAVTGDPAAAVRWSVRVADQRLVPDCPDTFSYLYFSISPSIADRIATFNHVPARCN
jgi:Zn-dependent protease with chaperone function